MIKRIAYTLLFLMTFLCTYAQRPENYPDADQGPMEITFVNVLIYFVFPLLIIVAYFWSKRRSFKKRDRQPPDKGKE